MENNGTYPIPGCPFEKEECCGCCKNLPVKAEHSDDGKNLSRHIYKHSACEINSEIYKSAW